MFVCLLHLTWIPFAFLAKALDWLSVKIVWSILYSYYWHLKEEAKR